MTLLAEVDDLPWWARFLCTTSPERRVLRYFDHLPMSWRRAISVSCDGTLGVWDLESGDVVASFIGDNCLCACVVAPDGGCSGNGFTIVAGEASGRVHFLWLEGVM